MSIPQGGFKLQEASKPRQETWTRRGKVSPMSCSDSTTGNLPSYVYMISSHSGKVVHNHSINLSPSPGCPSTWLRYALGPPCSFNRSTTLESRIFPASAGSFTSASGGVPGAGVEAGGVEAPAVRSTCPADCGVPAAKAANKGLVAGGRASGGDSFAMAYSQEDQATKSDSKHTTWIQTLPNNFWSQPAPVHGSSPKKQEKNS